MNSIQRFFSNTLLAFIANIMVKASSSLLFIFIGRALGPETAGIYNLGVTYFTISLAFSAWGLHELLVREAATRREQSFHYLINYVTMRLSLTLVAYLVLLVLLRWFLPYDTQSEMVIYIITLAIFPEALYTLLHALFTAHEQLLPSTLAALVNSSVKLGGGLWLLGQGADLVKIVWMIPISSAFSLLTFIPALLQLWRQRAKTTLIRLSWPFCRTQLRYTPGFIAIGIFSTLDFQLDALLISLLLNRTQLGWYGAAQTIMLGFWMMPVAIRTAVYPVMSRYYQEDRHKLTWFYNRANLYLLVTVLPLATGISLLARPIIALIFGDTFAPAANVLQWMIWAIIFAFLNVPSARLLLVYNAQKQAGWMTVVSMITNAVLNILLIPLWGIVGAGIARTLASVVFFLALYLYVQRHIFPDSLLPQLWRPLLANLVMAIAVWWLADKPLVWPVITGMGIYGIAIWALKIVPAEDWLLLRRLFFKSSLYME